MKENQLDKYYLLKDDKKTERFDSLFFLRWLRFRKLYITHMIIDLFLETIAEMTWYICSATGPLHSQISLTGITYTDIF